MLGGNGVLFVDAASVEVSVMSLFAWIVSAIGIPGRLWSSCLYTLLL